MLALFAIKKWGKKMFKLYGKEERCLWCGKKGKEQYKETTMKIKHAKPPEEKANVCSDKCEKKVLKHVNILRNGCFFMR